jgi:hypothetical protein
LFTHPKRPTTQQKKHLPTGSAFLISNNPWIIAAGFWRP